MKPNHVPGFLMTHSALAFVLGLVCAWLIDLGNGVEVVVLGTRLGAGLVVGAGAIATLLVQRIVLWGWKRYVRAQASPTPSGERRMSPAMAGPAAAANHGRRPGPPRPALP
ncbi:MAG: hypothetical protein HY705_06935 [Gemmatimonadetes bacterium]|nr:hypothetical protein [Gemmatimonadota bacterium]